MLMLAEMEKEYSNRGVAFVGASLDDARTKPQIADFVANYGITFPVWYGATGDDVARLGLGGTVPGTVFLDQEGQIVARVLGQIRKEEVKERLDWLLGDQTGPAPPAFVKHLFSRLIR